MEKYKKFVHYFKSLVLCFFFVIALFPFCVYAEETESENVRVGWYEDAYNITGNNGERSGYGYEFQQSVAAYTGWTYTYEKAGWSELLDMIQDGKIDLMSGVSYTEDRAEKMLFSELPMGEEKYYLYADLVNTDISSSDLNTLNGKNIGLLEESIQGQQFEEWEASQNLHMNYVYVKSFEEAKKKVANREVDCIISTETPQWVEDGMTAIATTGGSDIYFVINKNRPDLKKELDTAMRKMEYDKPFYADDLYKRYLSAVSSSVVTNEEKQWLNEHGSIRLGCLVDDGSVSEFDSTTGKIEGAINEYISFATHCLDNQDLEFELVLFNSQEEEMKALENDEIDVVFHFTKNPYIAENNGFILSNTAWSSTMIAITAQDKFNENTSNRVAIEKDNLLLKWYLAYNYPEWEIVEYNTLGETERAMESKSVDCIIAQTEQLRKYIDEKNLHSIYLMQTSNSSFAVKRNQTVLLSIMNKTLKTMPSTMLSSALSMYDSTLTKVTPLEFLKENVLFVSVTGIIVFLIVLLIVLRFLKKSRLAEAKAKQAAIQAQELNLQLQENHKELEDALERAESANSAKTTFLSNMSHDIRTPMNAIIGYTNIAKKQNENKDVGNYLQKIEDSSELLLTLINDVLDISRIESGHIVIQNELTDITAITDAVINVANGLLTNRKINFVVEKKKPEKSYIYADATRLRDILVNVLSNAVKFTEDGGTITFIFDSQLDKDAKQLKTRFVIADTGIGMSKEFQKHIFDEFSQEEQSNARTQYNGTGLGMAITKRYVDMMHGTISLQSEKNVGTTFVIEIPFVISDVVQLNKQEEQMDPSKLKGRHILLAEDNDMNAEIAMIQLQGMGIEVTRVRDGKEAVDNFSSHPENTYDLILMDVMMPVMNGYEATKTIRHLEERKDGKTIPIIALTANAFTEDIQKSLDAGMCGHISKPINETELIEVLSNCLD